MIRAIGFLLLASCAPATLYKPVDVEVPVVKPCVSAPKEKPDFALRHVEASDNLADKTRAALVELNQRRAYEAELEAQIEACMAE